MKKDGTHWFFTNIFIVRSLVPSPILHRVDGSGTLDPSFISISYPALEWKMAAHHALSIWQYSIGSVLLEKGVQRFFVRKIYANGLCSSKLQTWTIDMQMLSNYNAFHSPLNPGPYKPYYTSFRSKHFHMSVTAHPNSAVTRVRDLESCCKMKMEVTEINSIS